MTIQTIELCGERYVILPERDYLELQQAHPTPASTEPNAPEGVGFPEVVPLRTKGIAASELLIQDRR